MEFFLKCRPIRQPPSSVLTLLHEQRRSTGIANHDRRRRSQDEAPGSSVRIHKPPHVVLNYVFVCPFPPCYQRPPEYPLGIGADRQPLLLARSYECRLPLAQWGPSRRKVWPPIVSSDKVHRVAFAGLNAPFNSRKAGGALAGSEDVRAAVHWLHAPNRQGFCASKGRILRNSVQLRSSQNIDQVRQWIK
jgi:hypothetical protein